MATMGCFPCCSSKVEKHKIIIPNVNVNEEHDVITITPKFKKRLIRSSLTNSVKHLLKMKNTISFANISFKSESSKHKYISEELAKLGNVNVATKIFSYDEVCEYTNNFIRDNQIGEGGFGRVYKGYIEKLNQVVAVKQLDKNGFQGNKEFLVEIFILSLFHHPNLVTLVGYCTEGPQRILVYEYMANGSLEEHLLDLAASRKKPLDWHTRIKIALGAARGLEYLHETANPPVIYRDFKASNILIDENFEPKLSDFGLAKFGPMDEDEHVSTRVMGTYGYCAPEYALTGQLTTKSDVYSFGVVFLEIITGKRVFDRNRPSEEQNLVLWAQPMLSNKSMFHIMADPGLEGKYPAKGLYQALGIAAMCLQEEACSRPSMSDVVTALDYLSYKYSYSYDYEDEEYDYDDDYDYDYDYSCDDYDNDEVNDDYNDNDEVQGLVDEDQQRSKGDETQNK